MPFKSEKQRRFLWAEHPDIAKRWAHEYPTKKKLPMYAPNKSDRSNAETHTSVADSPENTQTSVEINKSANVNIVDLVNRYVNNRIISLTNSVQNSISQIDKSADSKQEIIDIPHSSKPVYAGEERNDGTITADTPAGKNISGSDSAAGEKPQNAINQLLTKLSVVLSPHIEQTMENLKAEREGRVAVRIPRNRGIKKYPCATPAIPLPYGMAQTQAQPQQNQQQLKPVGGGSHPQFNPINAFGAISMSGVINGNAAFGAKNSPDSSKLSCVISDQIKRACRSEVLGKLMSMDAAEDEVAYWEEEFADELAGCKSASILDNNTGETMPEMSRDEMLKLARCWAGYEPVPGKKPYSNDSCRPVGSGKKKKKKDESKREKEAGTPAWQRSEGKNDAGGLNEKGRKSYEREHGGNLQAPVTQKNPTGKAKKRQNSFCSRMCGMKRVNTSSSTAKDPDSRINKSLRKWNCKCSSAMEFGAQLGSA